MIMAADVPWTARPVRGHTNEPVTQEEALRNASTSTSSHPLQAVAIGDKESQTGVTSSQELQGI